jgi:hypothetical protein
LEKDDKPILISVCKVRRLAACGGGHWATDRLSVRTQRSDVTIVECWPVSPDAACAGNRTAICPEAWSPHCAGMCLVQMWERYPALLHCAQAGDMSCECVWIL